MNRSASHELQSGPRRILIVDDSKAQRMMLRSRLSRWGFTVTEAADGEEALEILNHEPAPLIISDWVMPGLTGPELCQKIRAAETGRQAYFILLTSKQDKEDVSKGLSAGADDFLTKPVDEGELRARLRAGLRQVDLQHSLFRKNEQVTQAYTELKTLYEQIENDLRAAATLQQAVLPPDLGTENGVQLAVLYQPAGHVGGDLVGYFPIGTDSVGLYGIDVSGHGIASSLLTIRLAQYFNANDPSSNIALERDEHDGFRARPPDQVVADLNELFFAGESHDLYLTIVYGILDIGTRVFEFCQAGHSHPLVLRQAGKVEFIGEGGPPVGLLPGVEFASCTAALTPGDRLLLYSDGIVEAEIDETDMVGEAGLAELVEELADEPLSAILNGIVSQISERTGQSSFSDDISILGLQVPDTRIG